ncbi:hypothetical protein [Halomontanus rarus]|uniref:hypothetical protein n=1 Tax=Halomontanus rarus TaxID=3034020 RepID=UPI001A99E7C2|nr:hypothetical protein [Halovivax sp. TS33]
MNKIDEETDPKTGRDILAQYADRGYTVEDVRIDRPILGDRPKRAEVTVELTLVEPVSSVLDRMESDGETEFDPLD